MNKVFRRLSVAMAVGGVFLALQNLAVIVLY